MPLSINGLAFSMRRRERCYLAGREAHFPTLPNSLVGHHPERAPELWNYERPIQARTSKTAVLLELAQVPY
jgi:hypothetical protein